MSLRAAPPDGFSIAVAPFVDVSAAPAFLEVSVAGAVFGLPAAEA